MKKWIALALMLAAWGAALSGCRDRGHGAASASASGSAGSAGAEAGSAGEDVHGHKKYWTCAMHPQYITDKPGFCPFCGMQLVPMEKGGDRAGPGSRSDSASAKGIRIDPTTVQNMGVKTDTVRRRDLRTELRTSGKIQVDESRLTIVNARVMGYAERLAVNATGQKVAKGQTLLELYSPDLVSAQEEYLQALRYNRATGEAAGTGAGDLVESSKRRLLNWGISAGEVAALEKDGHARNTLAIASPAAGVVLSKQVVAGQNVAPGMELYRIADLSRVWVVASVYQRDLAVAKPGAEAEVELNYLPGKPFRGKVTFISPVLDEQTKTASVRIEVANTAALDLKPEMFATVRILSAPRQRVIAVPEQAIIRSGRRDIAIVSTGDGYFEPRDVKLGASGDDYVEVTEGLKEGELLVISSQFLIDSESNLKAAIRQLQAQPAADSQAGAPAPGM
jgi:multidrug efflux pump subunit AcrA (membrane-fusion protein)